MKGSLSPKALPPRGIWSGGRIIIFEMCIRDRANMVGVAAGLSACGKIPFVHSFATFASRRCFDQIAISVCYAGLNVKIVGSDPGVGAELNGGTHMALEDMGIMRTLPGMTCLLYTSRCV